MRALVTTLTAACIVASCAPESGADAIAASREFLRPSPVITSTQLPEMAHPSCNPRHVLGVSFMDPVEARVPANCPAPSGAWTGGNAGRLGTRNLCAYTLPDHVPFTLQGLPSLPANEYSSTPVPPSQWATADCPAVTTMSDQGDEALAIAQPEFIKLYRGQIRRATTLPILSSSVPAPVEVAILDSLNDTGQAEPPAQAGRAQHGRAIKELISDLTCPLPLRADSSCRISLRTYQLFDLADGGEGWLEDARDGALPGLGRKSASGYLLRLAQRIDDARTGALRRGVSRLVINLSVGYHPRFSGLSRSDDVVNFKRATKAVADALDRAVCGGAIVIGAIGNREDGADPWNEPVFPAYLQSVRSSCNRGPLIYGASGLDPQRQPVSNAIDSPLTANPKIETPLAAPGFAVGTPNVTGGPLPLMTGSSFGAAGVSALAALVWSYRPDFTPGQVISLVHETAIDTGRVASRTPRGGLGSGASANKVKTMNACAAVFTAFAGAYERTCSVSPQPAGCRTAGAVQCDSASGVTPGTGVALLNLVPTDKRFALTYGPASGVPATCGLSAQNVRVAGERPFDFCPWRRPNEIGAVYGEAGVTVPLHGTPPHKPCVPCVVVQTNPNEPPPEGTVAGRHLLVSLDPTFQGVLADPSLRAGNKVLSLGNQWIQDAHTGLVSLSLPADFQASTYALTFRKTDDNTSISSEIPAL